MSLKTWADAGWLRPVPPDPGIVRKLLSDSRDNLRQCQLDGLGADWRLIIAYTVILNSATAALMSAGYRADRDQHHFRTLQSLEHTIGLETPLLRRLDGFRKKRHVSTYDRSGAVSDQEVSEITQLAEELLERILAWLRAHHPELIAPNDA